MLINVLEFSKESPYFISASEYERLIKKKIKGWSFSSSEKEWLCKLHYLREGYKKKKISSETFLKKEQELIINWWAYFIQRM